MARRSNDKPWLRDKCGYCCSTVHEKPAYLGKAFKVAYSGLRKLCLEREREHQEATPKRLDQPISNLADEFLYEFEAGSDHLYQLSSLPLVGPEANRAQNSDW